MWRDADIAINPDLLKQISGMTGGEYYRAVDRDSLKAGLQKVLDHMERSKLMEGGAAANYKEEFAPYLLWAFALLAGAEASSLRSRCFGCSHERPVALRFPGVSGGLRPTCVVGSSSRSCCCSGLSG